MMILPVILMVGQASVAQFACPAFMVNDESVVIAGTLSAERQSNPDFYRVRLDTDRRSGRYKMHVSTDVPVMSAKKPIRFMRLSKDSDPHWISYHLNVPGGAEGLAVTPPHIDGNAGDDPKRVWFSADCPFVNPGNEK